jgi:hypothetical protein
MSATRTRKAKFGIGNLAKTEVADATPRSTSGSETAHPVPAAVNVCPSGLAFEDASRIEDEILAVRRQLAVMFAAVLGMKQLEGDTGPHPDMIDDCLDFGIGDAVEAINDGLTRIVDLAFGKENAESAR